MDASDSNQSADDRKTDFMSFSASYRSTRRLYLQNAVLRPHLVLRVIVSESVFWGQIYFLEPFVLEAGTRQL